MTDEPNGLRDAQRAAHIAMDLTTAMCADNKDEFVRTLEAIPDVNAANLVVLAQARLAELLISRIPAPSATVLAELRAGIGEMHAFPRQQGNKEFKPFSSEELRQGAVDALDLATALHRGHTDTAAVIYRHIANPKLPLFAFARIVEILIDRTDMPFEDAIADIRATAKRVL